MLGIQRVHHEHTASVSSDGHSMTVLYIFGSTGRSTSGIFFMDLEENTTLCADVPTFMSRTMTGDERWVCSYHQENGSFHNIRATVFKTGEEASGQEHTHCFL